MFKHIFISISKYIDKCGYTYSFTYPIPLPYIHNNFGTKMFGAKVFIYIASQYRTVANSFSL